MTQKTYDILAQRGYLVAGLATLAAVIGAIIG